MQTQIFKISLKRKLLSYEKYEQYVIHFVKRQKTQYSKKSRILESLAGFRTTFLFAVFCKIGALERNSY